MQPWIDQPIDYPLVTVADRLGTVAHARPIEASTPRM